MTAADLVQRFVDAINEADVDRLAALMTDDHVFIDSDGSKIVGRAAVRDAWSGYFGIMSSYRVTSEQTLSSADTVVLVGTATGSWRGHGPNPRSRWTVPAAWRAVVKADLIALWQVFVNPQPILAAMSGDESGAA